MNQLAIPDPLAQLEHQQATEFIEDQVAAELADTGVTPGWVMKKLTPRHKQIASLVAQGLKYVNIATMVDCTPQYVSMLMRQELMKQEVARIGEIADTRLAALTEQSVEVIAETMLHGSEKGKLQAARMQLEATGRIGRRDAPAGGGAADSDERLLKLAERLAEINRAKPRRIFNEDGEDVTDVPTGPSA